MSRQQQQPRHHRDHHEKQRQQGRNHPHHHQPQQRQQQHNRFDHYKPKIAHPPTQQQQQQPRQQQPEATPRQLLDLLWLIQRKQILEQQCEKARPDHIEALRLELGQKQAEIHERATSTGLQVFPQRHFAGAATPDDTRALTALLNFWEQQIPL